MFKAVTPWITRCSSFLTVYIVPKDAFRNIIIRVNPIKKMIISEEEELKLKYVVYAIKSIQKK